MQFLAVFGYKRFAKIYFADLYPPVQNSKENLVLDNREVDILP